jgi:simple sugar transport system ATP-binding protein
MRIAFGLLRPDSGTLVVKGIPHAFRSSADAIAAGIGMVHQHFLLVGAMTVAENVALGGTAASGFTGRFNARSVAQQVRQLSKEVGFALDPYARVADLPVGAQQRVELTRALSHDPELLILDEPTTTLAPGEAQDLYGWLRGFVERGGTVILVTHKVREALALADGVTVLRHGRTVLSGAVSEFDEGAVVRAMLGDQESELRRPAGIALDEPGAVLFQLEDVSAHGLGGVDPLRDVTLDIRAGEIVGIVGLEGSGYATLLRLLAGRIAAWSGRFVRPDMVGFVPEDRLHDAAIPEMSLVENTALVGAGIARGRIRWAALRQRTARFIDDFEIVAEGPDARMYTLSGGNQQKFVLARELSSSTQALVVENPARGLDVRASERVRQDIVRAARVRGSAVVYYSSDLEEVLDVSDRIVVCFAGRVREVPKERPDIIARAMVGAA